jgi:murein DD-endopeptidase MepM/ murein hydrolase activator NlpD
VAAELLATGNEQGVAAPPLDVAPDPISGEAIDAFALAQRAKNRDKDQGQGQEKDSASTGIAWPMSGGEWEVVQGYNTGTHSNRSDFAQYKYSLDWARVDGQSEGQSIVAPVSGTVDWVDHGSGGLLINAGNGYGVVLFHVTLQGGISSGSSVERGQTLGAISGPGGDGYMSMAHVEISVWQLDGRSHTSVPFTAPNAIGGQEFPDTGGENQYMGAKVSL